MCSCHINVIVYNLFQKMIFTGTFDGTSWNNRVGVHSVLLATIKIPRIHSASYLNMKIMTTTYRHHEEGTTPNYVRSITFHLSLRIFIFWRVYLYLNLYLHNEPNNTTQMNLIMEFYKVILNVICNIE